MEIYIKTLGCKLNFAESSAIGKDLIDHGHTLTDDIQLAKVCVVNTCSVTDTADSKDRQFIHHAKKLNPDIKIIVTGCYAQLNAEKILATLPIDMVVGMNEKKDIPALIADLTKPSLHVSPIGKGDVFQPAVSFSDSEVTNGSRTRVFLKIQDGCDYFCSYCTIPLARGRSRNASIEAIVAEVRNVLANDTKEIILTGVNIGDFGKSTHERFIDLLQAIEQIECEHHFRVRVSSCEPDLLTEEIIDFIATSKHFAPHFHIPLQSGNNEILKLMRRHYSRELFAQRVLYIRQKLPYAFIGVDCMVGVRGETEEHFADYVQFMETLPVSRLHVFPYSERANTKMVSMPLHVVPKKERLSRSKILQTLSAKKYDEFVQNCKGHQATVLWEAKKKNGKMYGFTDNYIQMESDFDATKINRFEEVAL